MLLDGFNHVAILTNDSARLQAFYREVFDATVETTTPPPPPDAPPDIDVKLSFIYVGPNSELNVFEISGNDEAKRQTPMFGRGLELRERRHLGDDAPQLLVPRAPSLRAEVVAGAEPDDHTQTELHPPLLAGLGRARWPTEHPFD